MALTFMSVNSLPTYTALSTDISGSKIDGAAIVSGTVFLTDSGDWKIILPDLTLAEFILPVAFTMAGDIEIGAVEIKDSTSDTRAVVSASGLEVNVKSFNLTSPLITSGCVTNTVAIQQDVIASDANSFSGSLASSASFVGTSVSTLGVAGIQVSLYSTKNCTVWIEQSPDGTNWDISDSYDYHTNDPSFGITVQAINSYCRVIIKNISTQTASTIRLQTALCPIVESMPRSLSSHGNLKVSVEEMKDSYGFGVENTPNDEMRVITPYRLVGASLSGSALDANYWTQGYSSGSIVFDGSQNILTTGNGTSGSISIQSVRTARYIGGSSNRARMVIRVPDTGVANNTRRWGAFSTTDGAFFEISGSTPKVVTRKGGSDTPVENGSFNGDYGTQVNLNDFTTVKTYEIYWNNSKVYFAISGQLVHTISASDTTWTNSVTLPIRIENFNTSGTTNVALHVRNAIISRLGSALSQPTSNYTSGTTAGKLLKNGAGNLHSMVIGSQATTSVVTIYDGTSTGGNILFSWTYTQGAQANNQPVSIDFKGIPFNTGLFLVIGTANSNVTVIYE